jgi:hypothetical protein
VIFLEFEDCDPPLEVVCEEFPLEVGTVESGVGFLDPLLELGTFEFDSDLLAGFEGAVFELGLMLLLGLVVSVKL